MGYVHILNEWNCSQDARLRTVIYIYIYQKKKGKRKKKNL